MSWTLSPPFCKYTDFTGELLVANLVPTAIADPASPLLAKEIGNTNITNLNAIIAKYEKLLLTSLFGTDGYTAFLAEIHKATPATKFQTLYNMLFVDNLVVASYVYYWYMRNTATFTTGAGEAAAKLENSERINNNTKMCRAWNEFSAWISEVIDYLQDEEAYFQYGAAGVVFTDLLEDYEPINSFSI